MGRVRATVVSGLTPNLSSRGLLRGGNFPQYNLAPFPAKLSFAANRTEMNVAERFADASVQKSAVINLALIDRLDELIGDLELYLVRTAKVDDVQTFYRLRSIPGVGKVLALILLYEMHDVERFDSAGQFLSYARLVRC